VFFWSALWMAPCPPPLRVRAEGFDLTDLKESKTLPGRVERIAASPGGRCAIRNVASIIGKTANSARIAARQFRLRVRAAARRKAISSGAGDPAPVKLQSAHSRAKTDNSTRHLRQSPGFVHARRFDSTVGVCPRLLWMVSFSVVADRLWTER
jgi:hypothetical protein